MPVTRITDIPAWLARHGAFLDAQETETTVLSAALQHLAQEAVPGGFAYAVADAQGAPQLLAACTPPYSMVLAPGPDFAPDFATAPGSAALLTALGARLAEDGIVLTGVIGPVAAAEAFLQACCPGRALRSQTGLVLYEAPAIQLPPTPGELRPAGAEDEALVRRWAREFALDADLPAHEVESAADIAAGKLALGQVHLWWAGGAPRAIAAYRPTALDGGAGRIQLVYTPAAERRRGYGAAVAAHLAAELLAGGWRRVILFADGENASAQRIYERIGFRRVADFCDYALE